MASPIAPQNANTPSPANRADPVDSTTAAASAEAARMALQPLDPKARALEGYRIAAGQVPEGAGPAIAAVADAATSARTALERSDLTPENAALMKNVVERLGNEVIDGRIEPHINDSFRQHLYDLATASDVAGLDGDRFRGALAQMTRAAQVLDQTALAKGTQLGYDVGAGQPTRGAGLPVLNVDHIDADLYLQRADGTVHVESTKLGANTLASELKDQSRSADPLQIGRQADWRAQGTAQAPRTTGYFMLDAKADFTGMMNEANLAQLERAVGDPSAQRVVIGERAYSINELKQMGQDARERVGPHIEAARTASQQAGQPPGTFSEAKVANEFFKTQMLNPEAAMQTLGRTYGQPQPALRPLPQPDMPGIRQGAAVGAAAAGAITLVSVAVDGKLTLQDAQTVAGHTLLGAGAGALQAQGERALVPVLDRAIGNGAQRTATQFAAQTLGRSAAGAASTGVLARTVATRLVGSTAVGTAIATGMSVYDNREGLARGDARAIGNVAADTTVGLASVGASVAVGAAVGSVVPVVGTAVGAVAGLAVGVGVAYGAQISGARDAIADTVSGWVDGIKSWF